MRAIYGRKHDHGRRLAWVESIDALRREARGPDQEMADALEIAWASRRVLPHL